MPNISASDYTTYLKFKAAAATPIRPAIQTRDNATLSQSVVNANILASQAAFLVTPNTVVNDVNSATVSAASATTVTNGLNRIVASATGSGNIITYSTGTTQHGLTTGMSVTIADLTQNTLTATPNRTGTIAVTGTTTFTIDIGTSVSGVSSGTGRISGRVYYVTSVAHGLVPGDVISITGITSFTATNATVLAVPTATTFVISSTTDAVSVSGATGSITGLVYYTTSAAHGLSVGSFIDNPTTKTTLAISGMARFNQPNITSIFRVPSSTVFVLNTNETGTAVTGETGVLTLTTITNRNNTLRGLARVQGQPPNNVNQPKAKSTLSWMSGTSGSVGSTTSSKFVQPGGLPANNVVGTYTRIPTNAGWATGQSTQATSSALRNNTTNYLFMA